MKLLSLLFLFASVSAYAKELSVKFGTIAPSNTPWSESLEEIKNRVSKESSNQIKIKVYLGGQLGGELEIMQKIRRGNIEGGGLTCAAMASIIPELDLLEVGEVAAADAGVLEAAGGGLDQVGRAAGGVGGGGVRHGLPPRAPRAR